MTDPRTIMQLLDWCSLADEKDYQIGNEKMILEGVYSYYGKILKRDGTQIFVGFDASPSVQKMMEEIISKEQ